MTANNAKEICLVDGKEGYRLRRFIVNWNGKVEAEGFVCLGHQELLRSSGRVLKEVAGELKESTEINRAYEPAGEGINWRD